MRKYAIGISWQSCCCKREIYRGNWAYKGYEYPCPLDLRTASYRYIDSVLYWQPGDVSVYGGEEYSIKGIEQLDKYNKSLKVVNDYLKDFSSKIKDSITPISYETYSEIARNGISNVTITDVNLKPIAGTSYIGTVLYNADTGDYIKVLMDNDGNIVAANSLSSELSGGAERDSYFISMANKGLYGLQELFAKED